MARNKCEEREGVSGGDKIGSAKKQDRLCRENKSCQSVGKLFRQREFFCFAFLGYQTFFGSKNVNERGDELATVSGMLSC